MEPELVPQWSLTDEEWCELCFMIFELGETHQRLQEALLSEERPSLHQLWVQGSAFQRGCGGNPGWPLEHLAWQPAYPAAGDQGAQIAFTGAQRMAANRQGISVEGELQRCQSKHWH